MNALDKIIAYKKDEVVALKRECTIDSFFRQAETKHPPRPFVQCLKNVIQSGKNALICEFKRKSPSAGEIAPHLNPEKIARIYEESGAACLSILTDGPSFGGNLRDMQIAQDVTALPVLRKDFMIDPIQIYQSRAYNADAILLILAVLEDKQARDMEAIALDLGMAVLIEVHNETEMARALSMQSPLIGVNNRDLTRMITDLATSEHLGHGLSSDKLLISESGIHNIQDIHRLNRAGYQAFLIGETLMKADNIPKYISDFIILGIDN